MESNLEFEVIDPLSREKVKKWDNRVVVDESSDVVTVVAIIVDVCEVKRVWSLDSPDGK